MREARRRLLDRRSDSTALTLTASNVQHQWPGRLLGHLLSVSLVDEREGVAMTRLIMLMVMAAGCASAQPMPTTVGSDAAIGPSLTGLEPRSPMEAAMMDQARRHPNAQPKPHAMWPDQRPAFSMPGYRIDLQRRYSR